MKHLRLQFKTVLLFSLLSAVLIFCIYLYLDSKLTDYVYAEASASIKSNLNTAVFILQQQTVSNPNANQWLALQIRAINQLTHSRVTLIDQTGKVLADSEVSMDKIAELDNHLARPEVQEALRNGHGMARRHSATLDVEMLYAAIITSMDNAQVIVRVAVPLQGMKDISRHLERMILGALCTALLLAFGVSFMVARYVTRPIQKISNISKAIAQGDYQTCPEERQDEIGELGHSINVMSGQIKARIEQVTASESRLQAVLLSMFDGVMVLDSAGGIELVNSELEQLLELKPGKYHGRKLIEVVRNIAVTNLANEVANQSSGLMEREIILHTPVERNFIIHGSPIHAGGVRQGTVLIFHDITKIMRLEQVRKDFVANVSHELRTPLASIKGYAETLLDGALEDKDCARDFIKIINDEAERLNSLTKNLLLLARLEALEATEQSQTFALGSVFERVVTTLRTQAEALGIIIKLEISADLPRVSGIEEQITQALINLADNAIKYNRPNGNVTIVAVQTEDGVRIKVIDTGIGIASEDISRIFERFYRVDKGRSRELGGTGLGLAIVKHILQGHGAEIEVNSELGVGTEIGFGLKGSIIACNLNP